MYFDVGLYRVMTWWCWLHSRLIFHNLVRKISKTREQNAPRSPSSVFSSLYDKDVRNYYALLLEKAKSNWPLNATTLNWISLYLSLWSYLYQLYMALTAIFIFRIPHTDYYASGIPYEKYTVIDPKGRGGAGLPIQMSKLTTFQITRLASNYYSIGSNSQ